MLRRLSVFAGGWELDAAEAVCGDESAGEGLPPAEVLELHSQLVNKSLVVVERAAGQGARYRMLETIRQYALERLAASGDSENTHRKHMVYFCKLAQEADPTLYYRPGGVWVEKLKPEQDNLRAALQWARESGDMLAGLQLAGALWLFWYSLGSLSEGRGWLEGALAQAAPLHAPLERAKVLLAAGNLAWFQSDYAVGRARLKAAVEIFRTLGAGSQHDLAHSLVYWGAVERDQDNPAMARSLLEESVAISREIGDRYILALALVTLGRTVAETGNPAAARLALDEGRGIFRDLGDKYGQALSLNNLGLAAFRESDYGRATEHYREAISLFWQVAERIFTVRCINELAWVTCRQGHHGRATRLFGAAEAYREVFGASMPPVARAEHDKQVVEAQSQLGIAGFAAAWAAGRAMSLEEAVEFALSESPL